VRLGRLQKAVQFFDAAVVVQSLAAEDGEIADAYVPLCVPLCVHAGNAEAIKLIMETGENSDPQGGAD